MLVEDDNNLREIYEARLAAEGYEIVAAHDGEEALALAVKERPDLIISDVMMPKISGFDMLDILRGTPETRNTKVIMMTALGQAEDRSRADKLGADRYLVKSQVTLEDVIKVIQDILNDSGTADPAAVAPVAAADAAVADQAGPTPVVAAPAEPATPTEPATATPPVAPAPEPNDTPAADTSTAPADNAVPPATPAPAVEPPQPAPASEPPVVSTPEPTEPEEPATPVASAPAPEPEEPAQTPAPEPEAPAEEKPVEEKPAEPTPEPTPVVEAPKPKPLPVKDASADEPVAKSIPVTTADEDEDEAEKPEVIARPTPEPKSADDVADAPSAPFDAPTPSAPPVAPADAEIETPKAAPKEEAKPLPKDADTSLPKLDEPVQTEKEEANVAEQQIKDFVSSNPTLSQATDEPLSGVEAHEPPSHKKLVLTPTGNATKEAVDLDALLAKEGGDDASVPAPQTNTVITPEDADGSTPVATPHESDDDTPKVDPSQIAL